MATPVRGFTFGFEMYVFQSFNRRRYWYKSTPAGWLA